MQDFPSNSHKAKASDAPREKLAPVTSAQTRERKHGIGRKIKGAFFGGNAREAAADTVVEVIVPEIRDVLYNALTNTIDRMIFGDRAVGRRPTGRSVATSQATGHVNYAGMSTTAAPKQQTRTLSRQARARHDFHEILIDTRQAATEVLDRMYDIMSKDGMVSVADLYDLVNVEPSHVDMKWGWTSLRGARAVRTPKGSFRLELPEAQELG